MEQYIEKLQINTEAFQKLLAPISKKNPVGMDLRKDASPHSLYYQIKDERAAARRIERSLTEVTRSVEADRHWLNLKNLALKILAEQSKDLEVCAWLIEAWLRLEGIAGLAKGFYLIAQLIDRYWDQIFPLPDEEGLEIRLSPLVGLNGGEIVGSLIAPIAWLDLTDFNKTEKLALWQFRRILETDKIQDPNEKIKTLAAGIQKKNEIKQMVELSGRDFYQNLKQDIAAVNAAFQLLTDVLQKKCCDEAPPSSYIKQALAEFSDHFKYLLQDTAFADLSVESADQVEVAAVVLKNPTVTATSVIRSIEKIASREQALGLIQEVANFFLKTEPHSPLPFVLQRAVRWGRLSLPLLIDELISDKDSRETFSQLTGIDFETEIETAPKAAETAEAKQ